MSVVIRSATSNDVAVITEYNCRLAWETEHKTLDRATVDAGVRRGLELGDEVQYFVAEDESGVIGQIMLTREWSDWRNGWMLWQAFVFGFDQGLAAKRLRGVRKTWSWSLSLARCTLGRTGTPAVRCGLRTSLC